MRNLSKNIWRIYIKRKCIKEKFIRRNEFLRKNFQNCFNKFKAIYHVWYYIYQYNIWWFSRKITGFTTDDKLSSPEDRAKLPHQITSRGYDTVGVPHLPNLLHLISFFWRPNVLVHPAIRWHVWWRYVALLDLRLLLDVVVTGCRDVVDGGCGAVSGDILFSRRKSCPSTTTYSICEILGKFIHRISIFGIYIYYYYK